MEHAGSPGVLTGMKDQSVAFQLNFGGRKKTLAHKEGTAAEAVQVQALLVQGRIRGTLERNEREITGLLNPEQQSPAK